MEAAVEEEGRRAFDAGGEAGLDVVLGPWACEPSARSRSKSPRRRPTSAA